MANAFRGEASITLDGTSYTLQLDFNALCEFEEATGDNAMATLGPGGDLEQGTISASKLRALVWSMLQAHHPGAPLTVAGAILSLDPAVIYRVIAAGRADAPEGAPGNAPRRGKPRLA